MPARTVGIVGCGSIGSRYAGWLTDQGHRVVLMDTAPGRAAALAGLLDAADTQVSGTLDGLFAHQPDVVIVATPPAYHELVACAVLEAGIQLLCEKPLAHERAAAARIVETANRTETPAFGVCNMRFHPALQALASHLTSVGDPVVVRAHFGHRLAQMRPAGLDVFASSYAEGGGVVLDCVHDLDYLVWLLGPLTVDMHRAAQIGHERIAAEDWSVALLHAAGGAVRIELHLDFLSRYKRRGCEIIGTEATLAWESLGRRPERAALYLERTDERTTLWSSPAVDANLEYAGMLEALLCGRTDSLQSLEEAYSVLDLALTLRSREDD